MPSHRRAYVKGIFEDTQQRYHARLEHGFDDPTLNEMVESSGQVHQSTPATRGCAHTSTRSRRSYLHELTRRTPRMGPGDLGSRKMGDSETIRNHAAFIWSVADLLRGDYKQSEYGKVVLPLTVIRRLDCVLEPTKQAVLEKPPGAGGQDRERRALTPGCGRSAVLQHRPADRLSARPTKIRKGHQQW